MHPVFAALDATSMRSRLILLAGFAALLLITLSPQAASAHAALESSDPTTGDVLATAPSSISATFTEPLEQSYSRLELYDGLGTKVDGTTLGFPGDGYSMTLALPPGLPNGTYSVLWRTLSEADGHTAQNYFAFTIGSNADIAAVTIPGSATDAEAVPQWAKTTSRWAALLGVAALIACWPVWSTIVRPALSPVRNQAAPFVRQMRRFAQAALIVAIIGSLYALVVQAWALPDGTFFDKLLNTLGQTRYGHLWLTRIALISVLGLILAACGWWFTKRRQVEGVAAWIAAGALALPFSLIAHASAQLSGRTFAIAADAVHLFASAVWAGGIAILVLVVLPSLRGLDPDDRQTVLGHLLLRFSTMALICMAAIGVTGFYAGWLHVGNWSALTSTGYGKALFFKLIVLAVILVLAAINLLVIERRINDRAHTGDTASIWSKRLRWTVSGELVLILVLLLAVGRMTSLQPARDVMVERSRQIAITFDSVQPASTLLLAPGIAGVNHFRIEVSGPELPTDTELILRLTIPGNDSLGTKEIQLSRVAGNAFEHHGSELSIAADWQFTSIIRERGKAPISADNTVAIGTTAPDVNVPSNPWRFKTLGGVTGLVLVLVGLASLVEATRSGRGTTRKESGGLGAAALILGLILLFQARIDPILANAGGGNAIDPDDVAMVEHGAEVYSQQCLSCHGPELRGDGPASAGMQPPPADFSQPHTMVHADEDLIYWVRNGKQGTAMPAFRGTLSDQGVRDVLSYIESEQVKMGESGALSDPSACTVEPRSLQYLSGLSGINPTAIDATTPPAMNTVLDDATASGVTATTNQLLACTNAVDTMRRLSLFSERYLAEAFAAGVGTEFAAAATGVPVALPEDQRVALVAIRDIEVLEDGRVMATVEIEDPANHFHLDTTQTSTDDDQSSVIAQVVFSNSGDQWLIDEIIAP